jgi:methylated-DNA-[protein]-cysteine S-methyltransferase
MNLWFSYLDSPVGKLKLVASDAGLVAVLWEDDDPKRVRLENSMQNNAHPILVLAQKELREYFAGQRNEFSVPLDVRGTRFQSQVWKALRSIPFGETRTYGQIATQLGQPTASRAVGAANGRNPISIVMPCHRVIGSSGKLTGFAGGLEAKAFLLDLEEGKLEGY